LALIHQPHELLGNHRLYEAALILSETFIVL
jgi:hypothetical protein